MKTTTKELVPLTGVYTTVTHNVLKLLSIFQNSFKDALLFYMNLVRATRRISKNPFSAQDTAGSQYLKHSIA